MSSCVSRVAVLFFGISRHAQSTAASIRDNIIEHRLNKDIDFFCASSLNFVEILNNPRSGEKKISIDRHDIDILDCKVDLKIQQNDINIQNIYDIVKLKEDYHKNNHNSNKFLLHQLFSLKAGFNFLSSGIFGEFSHYLFLRPDLLYIDPVDVADAILKCGSGNSIFVPNWHSWGGINDRFAIASLSAARVYASRIDLIVEYCREFPLHSERLLAFALRNAGVSVNHITARACRVRATGQIVEEDFTKGGPPRLHPVTRP